MYIVHSIEINASRRQIFALYQDIATWHLWDSETVAVQLPGLQPGTSGWIKPRKGPKAKVRVTEVIQDSSFTVESLLPLCRMSFGHELHGERNLTSVTHWVRFTGPLALLFRRLIGREIDRTLSNTLSGLKFASERGKTHQ